MYLEHYLSVCVAVTSLGRAVLPHVALWISKFCSVLGTTLRPGTGVCSVLTLPKLASGHSARSHFQVSCPHFLSSDTPCSLSLIFSLYFSAPFCFPSVSSCLLSPTLTIVPLMLTVSSIFKLFVILEGLQASTGTALSQLLFTFLTSCQ